MTRTPTPTTPLGPTRSDDAENLELELALLRRVARDATRRATTAEARIAALTDRVDRIYVAALRMLEAVGPNSTVTIADATDKLRDAVIHDADAKRAQ